MIDNSTPVSIAASLVVGICERVQYIFVLLLYVAMVMSVQRPTRFMAAFFIESAFENISSMVGLCL